MKITSSIVLALLLAAVVGVSGWDDAHKIRRDAAHHILRQAYLHSSTNEASDLFEEQAKLLLHGIFSPKEIDGILREAQGEAKGEEEEEDENQDEEEDDEEEDEDGDEEEEDESSEEDEEDEGHLLSKDGLPLYADRHIRDFMKIPHDPDCMEREFDLKDPSYSVEEARETLVKCRLLVIRNMFDLEVIQDYKKNHLSKFLLGLHSGRVNRTGGTTNPSYGGGFMEERQKGRWEILLPKHLALPELVANPNVLKILNEDNRVLGPEMIIDGLGVVTANSGTGHQHWHHDDDYLFGDREAFQTLNGIAGHDLPPTQISMFTPMVNMTRKHGPTEYCVGSSYLAGIPFFPPVRDPSLTDEDSLYAKWHDSDSCIPSLWKAPLLNMGDIVLWDNQIDHRGGANMSPGLRTMLFVTYSRHWKHDGNVYDNNVIEYYSQEHRDDWGLSEQEALAKDLTKTTPFAVPDNYSDGKVIDNDASCSNNDMECRGSEVQSLEAIRSFMD